VRIVIGRWACDPWEGAEIPMRRIRSQDPAIVGWYIRQVGQDYDVIRLESVNTNYGENRHDQWEFQSCPGVNT